MTLEAAIKELEDAEAAFEKAILVYSGAPDEVLDIFLDTMEACALRVQVAQATINFLS